MTARVKESSRNREWLWVGLLVALAFLVRLALVLFVDRVVWGDEPFYLWLGRNWFEGRGYSFTGYSDVHHTPGYPFLSAVFYLITGNLEVASDICYVLFGTALLLPLYGLARRIYSREVGYIALLLAAVFPALTGTILFWGTMTEPPYYFFAYGAMFALLAGMERGRAWAVFLAGLAAGAAYIVRPEGIAYFAILLFYLVVVRLFEWVAGRRAANPGRVGNPGRRIALELLCLAVGFALIFMPYMIYVRLETGAWMVSEKAGVTFVTSWRLAYGDTLAFDKATWGLDSTGLEVFFFSRESYHVSMMEAILEAPGEFARLVYQNILTLLSQAFSPRMFPYFFLPLLGLGLFGEAWNRTRAKREFLLLLSLLPVMAFLVFFIQERYIAALLPTLILWLAAGLIKLGEWVAGTAGLLWARRGASSLSPLGHGGDAWRRWGTWLPTLLIAAMLVVALPRVMDNTARGSFRFAHKTVGLWMKDNLATTRDTVIMARYPAIAFYADAQWEPTPNATWPEVLRYARHVGADYFVLDSREVEKLRPQLAFLMDESQIPPELELVHVDTSEGERLVVYRIKPHS
ncbi:MAG: glycosyltransferase family 39 protein [Anaerolineae bacterium]|nr:glycosyltransferase family 39 protein [Anaerolineae bacterium]